MNCYLLIFVYEMDDFPIGLYATKREAVEAGKSREIDAGLTAEEKGVFLTSATTPLGLSVVEFKVGRPVSRTIVKWCE